MMNPLELMVLRRMKNTIEKNHPKLFPFLKAVSNHAAQEGTVIDVQVTCPDGKSYKTNLKVTKSDLEVLKKAKAQMSR